MPEGRDEVEVVCEATNAAGTATEAITLAVLSKSRERVGVVRMSERRDDI